ncbi:MAG: 50S ribosomal protein L6 [Crocinitomicaceae bacterium]|jgi:large subunit ribosomal protein L6|nr:50S ribosomal protein L6 [Crocinitomicaceae bacterium]
MSRIGNAIITIPEGVEINVSEGVVSVKGKKGELTQAIDSSITVVVADGVVTCSRESDSPEHRSKHGLYRSLINNMVIGVSEGYKTTQELVGVGYRAKTQGQTLELALGYSHPIVMELPIEVKVVATMEKGKSPTIELESCDKQLIGQVAAKIRSLRKPEPYKGKGIRFKGEEIRRKAGKAAG